jgi:hypothetical protein
VRRSNIVRVDRFDEMYDRDIEMVMSGGTPANTDLLPLRELVAELRSLAATPVSQELIDFHATEAAAVVIERQARVVAENQTGQGRVSARGLRRRAMTTAVSLAMLLGVTGMAWAADGAVPGDWNYGLDRALESIGIGAGGSAERHAEEQSLAADQPAAPAETGIPDGSVGQPNPPDRPTGLDRALTAVTQHPGESGNNAYLRRRAPEVLLYLNTTDHFDGAVVAVIARGDAPGAEHAGPPEDKGKPEDAGPPEDKGKPEDAGPPEGKAKPSD